MAFIPPSSTFGSTAPVIDIRERIDAARLNGAHGPKPSTLWRQTNEPTFQDDVDTFLRLGRVVTSFRRLCVAIRDPRCKRPHLIVLIALMEAINQTTGTAFPSRQTIGRQEELSEKTVENVLYELRTWGHIAWERRAAPDLHRGRLLHYVLPVSRWPEEELTKAINEYRAKLKSTRPDGYSESPTQRGEKVPAPTGTLEESPRPHGAKSPRPDGLGTY